MAGIFKKLSANDIKITPFEAHKQYDTTDLASIGAQTASLAWSGKNKSLFSTGSRQYYQIDKLYYRNYIQERANRLELDDATYTTQERRLYQSASLLSLSQKTFGSEVQPESFLLNITKGGITYNIQDDGFGNLFNTSLNTLDFPSEDNRVFYLGPVQAFKRANLNLNYETGNNYVNPPFPNGYNNTVFDDSYFLNEIEFTNVKFVTSANTGFHSIKTLASPDKPVDLLSLLNEEKLSVTLGPNTTLDPGTGTTDKLFDGVISTSAGMTFKINDTVGTNFESFNINFNPPLDVTDATLRTTTRSTGIYDIRFNDDENTRQTIIVEDPTVSPGSTTSASFSNISGIDRITYFLSQSVTPDDHFIREIELDVTPRIDKSKISILNQPQFNFEPEEDFTISFYYDFNEIDHNNSTSSIDYFILAKEGHKTVPTVPSETTQHTPLSSSRQFTTEPVGPQFPYRIFYKGNHPNNNTSSLFFERSDGEKTQFVSASFLLSGSSDTQKFVSCKSSNGQLLLQTNDTEARSSDQNSPTLDKTVSNQANITLFSKPNSNGSFSNFIGYNGGQISQLMIYNKALSATEITNISQSIVGTPNIGNLFYDNGFAVLTHPTYMKLFDGGTLNTIKYKNTHLITENEYQCTMTEDEFEFTTNPTARKIPSIKSEDVADFATGSAFKPFITTVGLHDDDGNLLVVGKLGQPIKASSETDTTFVIRFDT